MNELQLRCIIIDDDPTITDLVQHFCSKVSSITYCIACQNAIDGLKLISEQHFDILFLDYNMPDLNGKALLELKQDDSKVIMITSNPDFAVDSYNYPFVIDYLLKPLNFERFYTSIERYLRQLKHSDTDGGKTENEGKDYFIKDGSKWHKIELDDCRYIKSESNYVLWHVKGKQIISLGKLTDLESSLPNNFIRIHRSYIINKDHIDFLTREEVSIDNKMLPIGSKYKDILKGIVEGN